MAFWNKKVNEENLTPAVEERQTETKEKKKANGKRSESFGMCLTPSELRELNQGAERAGMTRTDYIMASVRGNNVIVIEGLPEILKELSRQGNNLNQLARQLNSGERVSSEQIKLVSYACLSTYTDLLHFVEKWDAKLKRMQEAKENVDYNN